MITNVNNLVSQEEKGRACCSRRVDPYRLSATECTRWRPWWYFAQTGLWAQRGGRKGETEGCSTKVEIQTWLAAFRYRLGEYIRDARWRFEVECPRCSRWNCILFVREKLQVSHSYWRRRGWGRPSMKIGFKVIHLVSQFLLNVNVLLPIIL